MNGGFSKGLFIGSIIGASVSMMMKNDMLHPRSRRKMMRNGRNFIRKSGNIISDVIDAFR